MPGSAAAAPDPPGTAIRVRSSNAEAHLALALDERHPLAATDVRPDLAAADVDPQLRSRAFEDDPVDRPLDDVSWPPLLALVEDRDVLRADVDEDRVADAEAARGRGSAGSCRRPRR